jgi:RNase P subunit RPR2
MFDSVGRVICRSCRIPMGLERAAEIEPGYAVLRFFCSQCRTVREFMPIAQPVAEQKSEPRRRKLPPMSDRRIR